MPHKIKITIFGIISLVILSIASGCHSSSRGGPPRFDGERAFGYLERQVEIGYRVPGSQGIEQAREYLIGFFDSLGARVDTMAFVHHDKYTGRPIEMVNILASFSEENKKGGRYLLAAHYDTRPRAEHDPDSTNREKPIPGANDGASGTAVLMEMGRLFSIQKPPVEVDLLLLDGEDYGRPHELDEYFLGSKNFVQRGAAAGYRFAIIVDMIGDRDQRIYREANSERFYPELNDLIWDTAGRLGVRTFIDSVKHTVYDDHLSFMTARVPSAVIIDFDYPPWHTIHDTPDKCSPQSLENVGKVLVNIIYNL